MDGERFEVRVAVAPDEILAHHRLRYDVYVEEMQSVRVEHLTSEDRLQRLERDWFDQYAVPFLVVEGATGSFVGAARLIRDTPQGFLMEQAFVLPHDIDRKKTVELSRFLIKKDKRSEVDRHDLAIGLYHWSVANGITTWCAALQLPLLYQFLADNVSFTLVGPPTRDYHSTEAVPVVLYDIGTAVRRLWALNRPLHFRYTHGRAILPREQDEPERARRQMDEDRRSLRRAHSRREKS
jgi:N-acyl-L-homoserine lactone synthetase